MIHVNRDNVPPPNILTDTNGKGQIETAKAIAHYTGPDKNESYKGFNVYRDPLVKEALIKLFKGKCAYCESEFLHVYSGDIEHFRPKGEVTEANPERPGYYWLAADWDNLLLSCRNCNQKLTHEIFGQTNKKTLGKMNQFPLADETKRVRSHKDNHRIKDEESCRLLLNPCIDNPEEHLEYDEKEAVIKPKKIDGVPSNKGKVSIDVFVLQRVPLVLQREKVLIEILAQIQRVKESVINFNNHLADVDATKRFYFEKIMNRELERLKKFIDPEEPYTAMARQLIGKFLFLNFHIKI